MFDLVHPVSSIITCLQNLAVGNLGLQEEVESLAVAENLVL